MSGTAPGPDFQPPEPPYGSQSQAYPPAVPPPPRRDGRDNTVRNLLIVLLIAIFTIVPATGMWVVASLKDKSTDDSAPAAATHGKAVATQEPAGEPAVVPGQGDPTPPVDPNEPPQGQPGQPGQPPQQGGPPPGQGGGRLCCCDGAPSKCTSPRKGCCQRHGGICPCQGGR